MWTCPDCGRSFANTNQWHACQHTTVDGHLSQKSDHSVAIYQEVVSALAEVGKFRVHAQKTRIAFITRMTFGGVSLARRWVDLGLILPHALDSTRVRRLELYGPSSWGHTIRLASVEEVDDEVSRWLGEAMRRGDQETLDPEREVLPIAGHQLSVFWTGFRGKVTLGNVDLPGYVGEALAMVDLVDAKVGSFSGVIPLERDGSITYIPVDPTTGLGDGDQADVFLKVAQ